MRRAYTGQEFMLDESGNVFGINLGFDFCCEHERGIEKLKTLFGVTGEGFGIEARKQTRNPGTVMVHEFTRDKRKLIALICFPSKLRMPDTTNKKQLSDLFVFNVGIPWEKDLTAAWDVSAFGIARNGEKG